MILVAKGGYVRVQDYTLRAVNKIVGKIQRETGKGTSANEVVWEMIEKLYPEIAAEERPKPSIRKRKDNSSNN